MLLGFCFSDAFEEPFRNGFYMNSNLFLINFGYQSGAKTDMAEICKNRCFPNEKCFRDFTQPNWA